MAFNVKHMTPHDAATAGAKIWSYKSSDDAWATIVASGYFDNHSQALTAGDIIDIVASDLTGRCRVSAISSGVVTVAGVGGEFFTGTTTKGSGVLPVPITNRFVTMTTGGVEALTLADGTPGQRLTITLGTDGGDGTLTPSTATGWATIVFADAGDTATLYYVDDTAGWIIEGLAGVAAAPAITV